MNFAKDQSAVPADGSCSGPSRHLGNKLDIHKIKKCAHILDFCKTVITNAT